MWSAKLRRSRMRRRRGDDDNEADGPFTTIYYWGLTATDARASFRECHMGSGHGRLDYLIPCRFIPRR